MEEFKRVREAIQGKPNKIKTEYIKDPKTGRMLVRRNPYLTQVIAGDVIAIAKTVPVHDDITAALLQGASAGNPERVVLQQAPDLWHLLSKAVQPGITPVEPEPEQTA